MKKTFNMGLFIGSLIASISFIAFDRYRQQKHEPGLQLALAYAADANYTGSKENKAVARINMDARIMENQREGYRHTPLLDKQHPYVENYKVLHRKIY